MHNIVVIGAVETAEITLECLVAHNFKVVGVMGHEPKNRDKVSGLVDLEKAANRNNLPYKGFDKINQQENLVWAREKEPDIIFAVGFSQLMKEEWLNMPTLGCIGFHPTVLPKGRGRAPLAWLVLEKGEGAATFFLMGEGADDGPIFVQSKFVVSKSDDASAVKVKIDNSIKMALNTWLPKLKNGEWNPQDQDELAASWYGKRGPQDGWIDWNSKAGVIDRLIKASTKPHPGAYTYFKGQKLIIWKSRVEHKIPIKGVSGRVLLKNNEGECLIQCGDGLLWVRNLEFEKDVKINVGHKLGFNVEDEIYAIKKTLKGL